MFTPSTTTAVFLFLLAHIERLFLVGVGLLDVGGHFRWRQYLVVMPNYAKRHKGREKEVN